MKLLSNKVIFSGFIINIVIVAILGLTATQRGRLKSDLAHLSGTRDDIAIKLRTVVYLLNDMQNEAKSFAINNNEKHLPKVHKAAFEVEKAIGDLNLVLQSDPVQLKNLGLLEKVIARETEVHDKLIEDVKYKGFAFARQQYALQDDASLNDQIDRLLSVIETRQETTFHERKSAIELTDRILKFSFIVCFWVDIVLLTVVLFIFRQYSKAQRDDQALLSRNESLLRSIMDNSPNLLYIKDISGHYLLANKVFSSRFAGGQDVKDKFDEELFDQKTAALRRSSDLEIIKNEKEQQVDEVLPINGVARTFLTTKFPIRDASGHIHAIGGISVDISEQTQQDSLIKEQADQIQKIFAGAPDAIIVIDEDSKILRWNSKAEQLFKWKAEEVLGKPIYDTIMPERFRSRHINGMKHFLQSGEGPILNKTVEVKGIDKDNVEIDIELTISASRTDKYIFISFIRDVTERKKMERDVQQTKNFLDSVLEHVPDMLIIKDIQDLRIVRANKAAENILGYDRVKLTGKTYQDLFSKEQADSATASDKEALEKRTMLEIPEELVETPSGRRWLHTKKSVILDDRDQPAYLLVVSEDISSRKIMADERNKVYKMLQASEEKMSLMLRNIGDGVVATDENLIITFMNSVAEKLSGWKEEEVKGKHMDIIFTLINEETRKRVENPAVVAVAEKKVISLEKDTILVRKDKSEIFIDDSGSPILNDNGNVVGSVLIFRDVTEEKDTQQQIRDSAKRFTQIFNLSPVAICISEPETGRFMYVNDAFCKMVGFTQQELVGKTSVELNILDAEQRKELANEIQKAGGHVHDIETILRNKQGNVIQVLYSVEPIQMDGVTALAIALVDISERKNTEMRIAMILENIDEGVILANAEQKILLSNRHADEILGVQEDYYSSEWTKRYDIFYPDGKTLFPAQNLPIEKALRGEEIHDLEIVLRNIQTGERKLLRVSGQPVFTQDNRLLAAVATLKDITQQRETERVLEETEMKYRKLIGFGRDKEPEKEKEPPKKDDEHHP